MRTFSEIKQILKNTINDLKDTLISSSAVHNLSIILYYEIKTHNKFIDQEKELISTKEEYIKNQKTFNESRFCILN